MEKIRQKPIEKLKTVIIAVLTVTMLTLAAIYIGGSQFASSSAAINAVDMPSGAVPVGEDAPEQVSVYEKNLLAISFIGIRYGASGGGSYATEQAALDLFEFALEPLHAMLSSSSAVSETDKEQFDAAVNEGRYICMSLVSPLPYQIIYALSGEYNAPLGSAVAINPEMLLLSFDTAGNTVLYMRDGEKYYAASGSYTAKPSELAAMASDSRLYDFEVTDGIPLSESSPLVQTLSLSVTDTPTTEEFNSILSLLDYSGISTQPLATTDTYTVVAPHGNLLVGGGKVIYTAADEGGIPITGFLDYAKSELDIDTHDVLLSSVSLVESLREAVPTALDPSPDIYLDGFYRNDDIYTVIFGVSESNIPIFGDAFPFLAKITVQGGRFRSIELNLINSERGGHSFSPFSSAWEYRYASKSANIHAIGLRYNAASLPANDLGAAWYCTGERTVAK